jgi:hypothetical protein
MYGYMRVVDDNGFDKDVAQIQSELAEYADREGFVLEDVFTEKITRSEPAFRCMLDALERNNVKNIIVPSLWHFACLPGLQGVMCQHIEHETGARIWVVQGR